MFAAALAAALVAATTTAPTPLPPEKITRIGDLEGVYQAGGYNMTKAAAVIVSDSGPVDRDGDSPSGLRARTYAVLAEALADHHIATWRYDKRGVGGSGAARIADAQMRIQTQADDVKVQAHGVLQLSGQSCVWLIGHGQGALVAELASQDNADVCGVVLLAAAGRKAGAILKEQVTTNLQDPLRISALKAISELEAGKPTACPAGLESLLRPAVQPYLISWLALDPAEVLSKERHPVLIIQGDNDLQVSVQDGHLLRAADPWAKLIILPHVNHVLRQAPSDPQGNQGTYLRSDLPMAPGLVEAIADQITPPDAPAP